MPTWIIWFFFKINLISKRRQADFLHSVTRRKYYVIKLYGKLIVTDRLGIKRLKSKSILKKQFDYVKLSEIAVYETPSAHTPVNRKS